MGYTIKSRPVFVVIVILCAIVFANAEVCHFELPGDVNRDCKVDLADPYEKNDIAEKKPEVMVSMKANFKAWNESCADSARGNDYN